MCTPLQPHLGRPAVQWFREGECVFVAAVGWGRGAELGARLPAAAAIGRSLRSDCVNTERLCFHRRCRPYLSWEEDLGLFELIFQTVGYIWKVCCASAWVRCRLPPLLTD